jgi:hypothetical protein
VAGIGGVAAVNGVITGLKEGGDYSRLKRGWSY